MVRILSRLINPWAQPREAGLLEAHDDPLDAVCNIETLIKPSDEGQQQPNTMATSVGCFISPSHVLASRHGISKKLVILFTNARGESSLPAHVQPIFQSASLDVGIIRLRNPIGYRYLSVRTSALNNNEDIKLISCAHDTWRSYRARLGSAQNMRMRFTTEAFTKHGMSGSPFLDQKNRVISIVHSVDTIHRSLEVQRKQNFLSCFGPKPSAFQVFYKQALEKMPDLNDVQP